MQKPLKILVVRFSSIGDIVLTSPVLRCIKNQLSADLHYLTKSKYSPVLNNNPNIDKLYTISKSISEVLDELKTEKYDLIIDLHNNIRSLSLSIKLQVKCIRYYKHNFKKLIYILFGINIIEERHVLDCYFSKLDSIGVFDDNLGLDFFINKSDSFIYDTSQKYISWCIGASYQNKKLSYDQILYVCNRINLPIVLLGDENDKELGLLVQSNTTNKKVQSFCGDLSLQESSYLLKNSLLVLTNDTGLMHIAAAFNKKIISFWGCTKPSLGFFPLIPKENSTILLSSNKRPCSKHGKYCRISKTGCVKKIHPEIILKSIKDLLTE